MASNVSERIRMVYKKQEVKEKKEQYKNIFKNLIPREILKNLSRGIFIIAEKHPSNRFYFSMID